MRFEKYQTHGAYHWRDYKKQNEYGLHARYVANHWIKPNGRKRLLDIGAGDGLILHLLQKRGWDAIGIDDNEDGIKAAASKGIEVQPLDVYHLDYDQRFDSVYFGDVIEHLADPVKALERIRDSLVPGGYLYVVTPPAKSDGSLRDPYHYREYTPDELVYEVTQVPGLRLDHYPIVRKEFVRMYAVFRCDPAW